ncbi:transposase [Veillonella sp. 3627]
MAETCRCKPQRKNYAVHVSATMAERARYMEKLSTDKYIQLTKKRNAVEGIPSVLRRRFRIDDIPTFGYLRSRQFVLLKIGTYNFNKLLRHNRRIGGQSAQNLAIA